MPEYRGHRETAKRAQPADPASRADIPIAVTANPPMTNEEALAFIAEIFDERDGVTLAGRERELAELTFDIKTFI